MTLTIYSHELVQPSIRREIIRVRLAYTPMKRARDACAFIFFLYRLSRSHSRSASSIVVKITISQLTGRSIIAPAVEFRGVLWMGAPMIDRTEFHSRCTLPQQTLGHSRVFLTTGTWILSAYVTGQKFGTTTRYDKNRLITINNEIY